MIGNFLQLKTEQSELYSDMFLVDEMDVTSFLNFIFYTTYD